MGFLCLGALGLVPASAGAHAVVQPKASRPAEFQRYTLTVPNEEENLDTDQVRVQVPKGFDFVLIEETPGWDARVVRKQDRIAELRWSGGSIPPQSFRQFHFIATNRIEEGTVAWPVIQRYGSKTVRWIGPPDSERPASRTDITEKAVPVDTVGVQGERPERASSAQGAQPAAATAKADDRDELALGIGIGALAIAGLALFFGVGRRRAPVR